MFDPHKLQQNILQNNEKSYQNNFIDFGDQDIVEDAETKEVQQEEVKKEETGGRKGDRKRGKKDRVKKPIINSDEEITEEQS